MRIGETKMQYAFFIDYEEGKTTWKDVQEAIASKVNNYDVDEETYNRLDTTGHGDQEINAPRSIRDVWECCHEAEEYLRLLHDAVNDICTQMSAEG